MFKQTVVLFFQVITLIVAVLTFVLTTELAGILLNGILEPATFIVTWNSELRRFFAHRRTRTGSRMDVWN
jgi:hypothetical protein